MNLNIWEKPIFILKHLTGMYVNLMRIQDIGILLCRDKDDEVVEYALNRSLSPTMVAQYLMAIPDKKLLQQKFHELFQAHQVSNFNLITLNELPFTHFYYNLALK